MSAVTRNMFQRDNISGISARGFLWLFLLPGRVIQWFLYMTVPNQGGYAAVRQRTRMARSPVFCWIFTILFWIFGTPLYLPPIMAIVSIPAELFSDIKETVTETARQLKPEKSDIIKKELEPSTSESPPLKCEKNSIILCANSEICKHATTVQNGQLTWTDNSGDSEFVTEAKIRELKCGITSKNPELPSNCYTDVQLCNENQLCNEATSEQNGLNVWETREAYAKFVLEAIRRNLSCNTMAPVILENPSTPSALDLDLKPASKQPNAHRNLRMTADEKITIINHLKPCWTLDPNHQNVIVTLRWKMSADGKIIADSLKMVASEGGDGSSLERAFKIALGAVLRCGNKMGNNLPPEKYDAWNEIEVRFDPAFMRIDELPKDNFYYSDSHIDCSNNVKTCSETQICNKATFQLNGKRFWETHKKNWYTDEAKSRGLDCGVTKAFEKQNTGHISCASDAKACNKKQLCFRATENSGGSLVWRTMTSGGHVKEAKRLGLTCEVNLKRAKTQKNCYDDVKFCNQTQLCKEATLKRDGKYAWDTRTIYARYVNEAKIRGLECGIKRRHITGIPSKFSFYDKCTINSSIAAKNLDEQFLLGFSIRNKILELSIVSSSPTGSEKGEKVEVEIDGFKSHLLVKEKFYRKSSEALYFAAGSSEQYKAGYTITIELNNFSLQVPLTGTRKAIEKIEAVCR
jgi:hypothetical protein